MKTFIYEEGSNTIRLMPENYLIAFGQGKGYDHWIVDVDAAVKDKLAAKIFLIVRSEKFNTASKVIEKLNKLL